jgi:hypothetical protein
LVTLHYTDQIFGIEKCHIGTLFLVTFRKSLNWAYTFYWVIVDPKFETSKSSKKNNTFFPKIYLFFSYEIQKIHKMIEKQRQRVEQEMTKFVDEVDRSFLRKMQVK